MRMINVVRLTMERLKSHVMENSFADEEEEIRFFKLVKPMFTSKLIYLMKFYRLESIKPAGDTGSQKKLFELELSEIQESFFRHQAFYQYYRSGASYLDRKYFLRTGEDIFLMPDPHFVIIDGTFCTTHDYLISELIAYERYAEHLYEEIRKLDSRSVATSLGETKKNTLTWTESKAALFELIYAVFSVGAINNGNIEIKEIANFFAEGLNVEVGNIYRAAQELRLRKISRTKFLAKMIKRVEDRWNEQDENPKF